MQPENILLNSDGKIIIYLHHTNTFISNFFASFLCVSFTFIIGHLCLTDFGLSKAMQEGEKARTFCGTLEYMGK